jgi:hypothetical protein
LLVQDYRLNKIVDLRSEEVRQRPDRRIAGTGYVHIDLLAEAHGTSLHRGILPAGQQ